MSVVHLLILVLVVSWVIPLWRIMRRTGKPAYISLLGIIPLFGIFVIWYIAFADWDDASTRA